MADSEASSHAQSAAAAAASPDADATTRFLKRVDNSLGVVLERKASNSLPANYPVWMFLGEEFGKHATSLEAFTRAVDEVLIPRIDAYCSTLGGTAKAKKENRNKSIRRIHDYGVSRPYARV